MATRLPLFPLSTVLVPGLVLPLHIFEQRYQLLVRALLDLPEGAPRHFGVIATRPGRDPETAEGLYEVGCTAQIREVTPYDDGRFDLVTVGHVRFELKGLDADADTPYHTGLVDFIGEPDGPGDLEAAAELVGLRFAAYRDRLRVEQSGVPTDPRVLSYLVAAAAVLELPERQALLAAPSTHDRLTAELGLLRREIGLLDAFSSLPAVELTKEPPTPN
ncbi:LON peptidase substrate-binding domain-containing protein [Kineosporia sp. J2-2]|uniref:LON peptidase substrate-binding domain-containing protein n=1 Tax=Kineosporia corallincola TaxID=2835133 RepID=A0ABS5TJT4_9ACTN|nr:LON peptidase substrate-binding domain-containing protein [Kineosporia corallincola]MBT0771098.1 LON peptidase substrate-binding domain-containing protein [Kineosporia corallincola]